MANNNILIHNNVATAIEATKGLSAKRLVALEDCFEKIIAYEDEIEDASAGV